jgi:hypothetical protein
MPEPMSTTTVAVATLAAASMSMPMLTLFGVPLGLRADLLIAGFFGSLVAIILLNSVPGSADTWTELIRTTLRRMFVAVASSLTAGYLTPLVLLMASLPDPLLLSAAFAVGGGAQKVLVFAISRASGNAPAVQGGA